MSVFVSNGRHTCTHTFVDSDFYGTGFLPSATVYRRFRIDDNTLRRLDDLPTCFCSTFPYVSSSSSRKSDSLVHHQPHRGHRTTDRPTERASTHASSLNVTFVFHDFPTPAIVRPSLERGKKRNRRRPYSSGRTSRRHRRTTETIPSNYRRRRVRGTVFRTIFFCPPDVVSIIMALRTNDFQLARARAVPENTIIETKMPV